MYALFFSDIHLFNWSKFNKGGRRLAVQLAIFEHMLKTAMSLGVPVFFGGDLFHSPVGVSNSLLSVALPRLVELFNQYPVEFYAVSGNHDLEGINTNIHRSPSYINTLSNTIQNFHNLDFESVELEHFAVHGIPYLTNNVGFEESVAAIQLVPGKFNILLNHGDYKGQKDTNGIIIGRGENVDEASLKKFDLVMSGHVHKAGHLRNNLYSIGSTQQNRLSDLGGSFGYWSLKNRFRLAFKEIDWSPKFRMYSSESEIENDTDFWVKEPKTDTDMEDVYEEDLDLQDRVFIGRQYLEANKVTSRKKRALLLDILNQTEDE